MSSVSQTPTPFGAPVGRLKLPPLSMRAFLVRTGLTTTAAVGVIALSMSPAGAPLMKLAAQGRLHAPNLAVWSSLGAVVQVHVLAALAALALGAVLMLVRKGRAFHRVAGWAWVALVATTAGASVFITQLSPGHWSLLHIFTAWTLLILPLGVIAALRHKVAQHRGRMMGLFYGGFAINLLFAFIPGRAMWVMFFG